MEKFLSMDFIILLLLAMVLLIIHELGHWLAYRLFGYQAVIRKSIIVPGIDPKETIEVKKGQGLFIALSGFAFSSFVVILPCFVLGYRLWHVLLIGGVAGACLDFIWALGMIFQKTVTISARK